MIPLMICSVLALAVIIERLLVLRKARILDRKLIRMIHDGEGRASLEQIASYCQSRDAPFHRIGRRVIDNRSLQRSDNFDEIMHIGRQETRQMERNIPVLEIIAQVAPLLGLLGTVIGMVDLFTELSSQGMGAPSQALAQGISKALITTVTGLVIAIPSLVAYSYFSRLVDTCMLEIEKYVDLLLNRFYRSRSASDGGGRT